jgi:hypothetical protein
LTVTALNLDRGEADSVPPDLLEDLSRDRWQRSLQDSFLRAVSLHGVVPPPADRIPSLFRVRAEKAASLTRFLNVSASLDRDFPRLIDLLCSLYQHDAASTSLDLEERRRLKDRLEGARKEMERLRALIDELKASTVAFKTYDRDKFDVSMDLIARALDGGRMKEFPSLLVQAARQFDPKLASELQIRLGY